MSDLDAARAFSNEFSGAWGFDHMKLDSLMRVLTGGYSNPTVGCRAVIENVQKTY